MSGLSSMNRHVVRVRWTTIHIFMLVLWALFGLTESTEFETRRNSVCWLTAWNETLPSTTSGGNETLGLAEIYQEQFGKAVEEGYPVIMLPSCLADGRFSLSTETISTPAGDRVYSGDAQFRIQLNTALSDIDQRFSFLDSPSITVWFRILACDVQKIGFCHLFVDMQSWSQHPIPVSMDSSSQKYQLTSHEESDGVMSSQWLEVPPITLVRGDNNAFRLDTLSTLDGIIPADVEGMYEFVGHAAIHLVTNESYYRADIASSLTDTRVVAVTSSTNRPEVFAVEKSAKIIVGVIIGVAGTAILFCFGIIVYYRNHRVMTMAQAGLLGWLTVACFFSVLLAFLVLPTRDAFCQYSSLAIIPSSMIPCILIGRLFRVYSTLGKAHRLGKNALSSSSKPSGRAKKLLFRRSRKAEEMIMAVLSFIAFSRFFGKPQKQTRRSSSSLRRATTRNDGIRLILVLSTPQIILQIIRTSLYDSGLILEWDEELMTVRQICDDSGYRWARYTGLTLVLLQYILCLFIAWCSRDLPAAFNETYQIFKAALWGGIFSLSIVLLQIFFDLPSTSPSLSSILNVTFLVSESLFVIVYIVLPKIRRVLSGKIVVVSHLLRETATLPGFGYSPGKHPNAEGPSSGEEGFITTSNGKDGTEEPVKLAMKRDDPLPVEVETEMYILDEVIGSLKDKCMSGHAINADEFQTLREAVSSLSKQVERVDFDEQSADDNIVVNADDSAMSSEQSVDIAVPAGQETDDKTRTT